MFTYLPFFWVRQHTRLSVRARQKASSGKKAAHNTKATFRTLTGLHSHHRLILRLTSAWPQRGWVQPDFPSPPPTNVAFSGVFLLFVWEAVVPKKKKKTPSGLNLNILVTACWQNSTFTSEVHCCWVNRRGEPVRTCSTARLESSSASNRSSGYSLARVECFICLICMFLFFVQDIFKMKK